MNRTVTTTILFLTVFCLEFAWADPAAPIEIELRQPDGKTFIAIPRGDEFTSWTETLDGHSVVRDRNTWFYAEKDNAGELRATLFRVGDLSSTELQAMPLHVRPKSGQKPLMKEGIRRISTNAGKQSKAGALLSAVPAPHTQRILTILVDYSDQSFTYTDASVRALIYGAGFSVKKFYLENSYGRFNIVAATDSFGTNNDGIVHITRATTHPNQAKDHDISRVEASEIVGLTDAFVNYAAFDTNGDGNVSPDELSILIVLAGYATSYGGADAALAPNVWPHAYSFESDLMLDGVNLRRYTMTGEAHATSIANKHQATIGTVCHELGHLALNLPDLYDIDGSSEGIGSWGLMGNGGWNQTGVWSGDRPGHMSAWSKVATNFTMPQDIDSTQANVAIARADLNENTKRIWIDKYKRGEYFLVENRQKSNFDAGLPGSGLIIWHADDQKDSNEDENHKWVDVEAADGQKHLDSNTNRGDVGDPFPGLSGNTSFNNASTPNSRSNAGVATQIGITGISASKVTMTANMSIPPSGRGDNLSYFPGGGNSNVGYDSTTVWTGLRATNDTAHATFDGVDVHVNDDVGATIDIFYYTSIASGLPTGLIHTQTGIAAGPGWNRLLLATPQPFPKGAVRAVVLKIVNNSFKYPASYVPTGTGSGRSYIDANGSGAFFQLCPSSFCGDLNMAVLLSTPSVDEPAKPTGIKATDGVFPDKVRVTFNTVAGATVYRVFRCTTAGQTCGNPIGFPKNGTFDDTGGAPGVIYFYRVRACNSNGCGKFSSSNTGFRSAGSVLPGKPAMVRATDGSFPDKVIVTFNTVSGATVYRVFRCTTDGQTCGSPIGFPRSGTFEDTNGDPGKVYYYRVRGCNSSGCGKFSAYNTGFRSTGSAVPGKPTTVRASDGNFPARVRVTWDKVMGAFNYRIYRCPMKTGDCGSPAAFTKNLVLDDRNGTAGVVYYYRVRACTQTGRCGKYSAQNPGHRGTIPSATGAAGIEADIMMRGSAVAIPALSGNFGRTVLILMLLGFGMVLIKRRYVPAQEKVT